MATNPFDATTAKSGVPAEMVQNTFVHWNAPISVDYADRRYEYRFKRNGERSGSPIVVPVPANGYVSMSVNWAAAEYYWALHIVRQSDNASVLVDSGMCRVAPDAASGVDFRPHARVMLEKIEGLLVGRADSDVQSYTIGNRQISRMTLTELRSWRDYYRAEVIALNGASGKARPAVVNVRFI